MKATSDCAGGVGTDRATTNYRNRMFKTEQRNLEGMLLVNELLRFIENHVTKVIVIQAWKNGTVLPITLHIFIKKFTSSKEGVLVVYL